MRPLSLLDDPYPPGWRMPGPWDSFTEHIQYSVRSAFPTITQPNFIALIRLRESLRNHTLVISTEEQWQPYIKQYGEVTIQSLKRSDLSLEIKYMRADNGRSLLHCAAQCGYIAVLRLLLYEFHISINDADTLGYTALHVAAQAGQIDAARFLINQGADSSRQLMSPMLEQAVYLIPPHLSYANAYQLSSLFLTVQWGYVTLQLEWRDTRLFIRDIIFSVDTEDLNAQCTLMLYPAHSHCYQLIERKGLEDEVQVATLLKEGLSIRYAHSLLSTQRKIRQHFLNKRVDECLTREYPLPHQLAKLIHQALINEMKRNAFIGDKIERDAYQLAAVTHAYLDAAETSGISGDASFSIITIPVPAERHQSIFAQHPHLRFFYKPEEKILFADSLARLRALNRLLNHDDPVLATRSILRDPLILPPVEAKERTAGSERSREARVTAAAGAGASPSAETSVGAGTTRASAPEEIGAGTLAEAKTGASAALPVPATPMRSPAAGTAFTLMSATIPAPSQHKASSRLSSTPKSTTSRGEPLKRPPAEAESDDESKRGRRSLSPLR